jgi:hypothetical protein
MVAAGDLEPYLKSALSLIEEDEMMRQTKLLAAGFSAFLAMAVTAPAFAGYGALAHDDGSGKYGLSSNEDAQNKADDVAMKECGSDKCKIVFRTAARECGAIALAGDGTGNAWGAGKHPQRATAELAAVTNCQKHTKGQCKVKAAECNK